MAELKATQGKTGTMFSNEEYQNYIERLKAISQPGYDMKPDDYYLVKRFKILRVEINGKIYERLVKPGSHQLKYITFEGLFDAISEAHKPGNLALRYLVKINESMVLSIHHLVIWTLHQGIGGVLEE